MEEKPKRKKVNPYTYDRPLEPSKDSHVIVPREKEVYDVVGKLMQGKYCAVLGPRGIGKSTFLHQVKNQFMNMDTTCLYLDLNTFPQEESVFYKHLEKNIITSIPHHETPGLESWITDEQPVLNFFDFLTEFKPFDTERRIVLLFDNIGNISFLHSFLKGWRKVFHEANQIVTLKRFVVGIAVDVDLIEQTVGPTSPFNIAQELNLKDFSKEESMRLIKEPMSQLNIDIQPAAMDKLIDTLSGHPQMLQQACHWLVENAIEEERGIYRQDVENATGILIGSNSIVQLFREELDKNERLRHLLAEIQDGRKKKFHPYKEYAYMGTGAIVEHNYYCAVRNHVFETVFNRSKM